MTYEIVPISYTKLDNSITTGAYSLFVFIAKMVASGGNIPDRPTFFYDYSHTDEMPKFLRASIIARNSATDNVPVNSLPVAYWDYRNNESEIPLNYDVATGNVDGFARPTFRIFCADTTGIWYPLPPGTRLLKNTVYRMVWQYPIANYSDLTEFSAANNDQIGAIYIEDAACNTSTPDYPALKKK